jgi:predicted ATPase
LNACKLLFIRESQIQPLIVVFENLHWSDTETQAFLHTLLESLPTARILLLVNYRPEYQHGGESQPYCTQLRLNPLPPAHATEILHALLGEHADLQALQQRLIAQTEGNPFFLEEIVRTLVETKVLVGEQGAYRLAQAPQIIQIPPTVQAVLAARMDWLPAAEKRLLQCAAVIGKDVPFSLLQALTELPAEDVRRRLMSLQAAEFLEETRLFPEPEYTFKHALTHEVAYTSLLKERRRALHARIVEAMEALAGDRLTDHVEPLAYHAFRGEVWDKAFAYSRQAGSKAVGRSAHREAIACFKQALDALQHLPQNRSTYEQAIDLHFELRNALVPLGELEQIIYYLREAEALAMTLNDQRRLGLISCYMTSYFWVKGDPNRAIEAGQRALSLASSLGDFALQIETNHFLGQAYCTRGDYRQAIACLEKNVTSLIGDLLRERFGLAAFPSVHSRTWLIWCLAEIGSFTEGSRRGAEAVQIAEAANHPYSLTFAYFGVGLLSLRKGELHTAISVLERGLQLCQTWHLPIRFPSLAATLGYTYALSGRVTEAMPLLERAVEQTAALGRMDDHSLWITWLSEVYVLAGRIDEARQLVERALELSLQHNEWGHRAYAFRLLGEIASQHRPDHEKAEDAYTHALSLAHERGMRPLLAQCHYGLASLYQQMGRWADARTELSAAIALFRALAMLDGLARAQARFVMIE